MTLDRKRDYTVIGGRHPVCYVQDDEAYDRKGQLLGPCTPAGELLTGKVDTDTDLSTLRLDDLRALAEAQGVDPTGLKKADLVKVLTATDDDEA